MAEKIAIVNVSDTGPLESIVVMLQSVGYVCLIPNEQLKRQLRNAGCDTVLDIQNLVSRMGYENPFHIAEATPEDMGKASVFVDVKAHRNAPKIWEAWPNLKDKVLWYRINGGMPEVTEKGGDEMNLICPILTPNLHYANDPVKADFFDWDRRAYVMWPPFYRFSEYGYRQNLSGEPICLIHNVGGWGYSTLIDKVREIGVRCYGVGSPDGLIRHEKLKEMFQRTVAMVHLKSNDCPGYALYESIAANCPVIVSRRLIGRMAMQDLFIEGETCYCFDREEDGLPFTEQDAVTCQAEIMEGLRRLSDSQENARVGENARYKLANLMWDADKPGCRESLFDFMSRNFKD